MKRVRLPRSDKVVIDAVMSASRPDNTGGGYRFGAGNGAYDPKYPGIAKLLCQRGATLAELAIAFDVSTTAINNWLSKYPEFGEAVSIGAHEQFDPRVERSLAEQALGFYVDEEKAFVIDGVVEKVTVRRYIPPNATATIFFLKNRLRDKYRDVQHHEVENKNLPSPDELRLELVKEFQQLIESGVIKVDQKLLEAPKGNGRG